MKKLPETYFVIAKDEEECSKIYEIIYGEQNMISKNEQYPCAVIVHPGRSKANGNSNIFIYPDSTTRQYPNFNFKEWIELYDVNNVLNEHIIEIPKKIFTRGELVEAISELLLDDEIVTASTDKQVREYCFSYIKNKFAL